MVRILTQTTHRVTVEGITASTIQTQGQEPLTVDNNVISTIANDNDTVTLTTVDVGIFQRVINNGENILQVFPGLGQDLGNGLNNPISLPPNEQLRFLGINQIKWRNLADKGTNLGLADLDFGGFNALNVGTIISSVPTPATGGFLRLGNGQEIRWRNSANTKDIRLTEFTNNLRLTFGAVDEFEWSEEAFNLKGNNVLNFGYLKSNAALPALDGVIRMGNGEEITWRNADNSNDNSLLVIGNNFKFDINQVAEYEFNATQANWKNNSLTGMGILSFADFNISIQQAGTDLQLDAAVTGKIDLRISDITEYDFTTTEADWNSNNLINVHNILPSTSGSALLATDVGISRDTVGIFINHPTGTSQNFGITFGDVNAYTFSETQLRLFDHELQDVELITSNSGLNRAEVGFIRMGVGISQGVGFRDNANLINAVMFFNATDQFELNIGVAKEYTFGAITADWNNNDLVNMGVLSFSDTDTSIGENAFGDLEIDVATGESIIFRINNMPTMDFSAAGLNFQGGSIAVNDGDYHFRTSNTSLQENISNELEIDSALGKDLIFRFDNIPEYTFNSTNADFLNNSITNVSSITTNTANPATIGNVRFANIDTIQWRNQANTANLGLTVNASDQLLFDGAPIGIAGSSTPFTEDHDAAGFSLDNLLTLTSDATNPATIGTIRLGSTEQIAWRNSGNDANPTLSYDSLDRFAFDEDSNTVRIAFNANHLAVFDGTIIAELEFRDNNNLGVMHTFGQITTRIENANDGAEQGEMLLQLIDGPSGLLQPYVVLNDENDDAVTIKKNLQVEKTVDFKNISIPNNAPPEEGRMYVRQIDADNNALFIKIQVGGTTQEVRLS